MDRDVKQYLKWLGIVALVIIVGNLLAGCVRPQTAPAPKTDTQFVLVPSPTYVPLLPLLDTTHNILAMTACDYQGNPVVYMLPSVILDTFARKYVLVHEGVHVQDALRYGCKAFVARYVKDADFKWDVEARAYCTAFLQMVADKVAKPEDWTYLVQNMGQYNTSLSEAEIPKYLPCRPP